MSNFNTSVDTQSGTVFTNAGGDSSFAKVILRQTSSTVPVGPDAIHVLPFTQVMLDKRAPGMFSQALSGSAAKMEALAELLVSHGQVAEVARLFLRHDVVAQINERLLRGNARFKQGVVLFSYPGLYRILLDITGASTERSDPKRVAARVVTELFARIYASFGVMMPFRPLFTQETYDRPVATTDDLIKASHIATITETLEALKLGPALKEKEFSAGVVETLMGPLLLNAANKLMASEKYNRWMRDAAALTGMFLRNVDDPALVNLRDDANLTLLATNASFAFDTMAARHTSAGVLSPVHEHRELIEYASLRLRELRKYETVSMDKFANMYSYNVIKTSKGRVAGVFVSRNLDLTVHNKAIVLSDDSEIVVPMNAFELDPYMPMLNEFTNAAFGGRAAANAAHAFAQHVVARYIERDPQRVGGTIVGFNITETELNLLACAHASEIIVATPTLTEGPGLRPTLFFGVRDTKTDNYISDAYYNGASVYTSEPGEVFILRGEDFEGNQRFVTKPQTYAEELFTGLLESRNPALYNDASKVIDVTLPLPDGTSVQLQLSLYSLLTGLLDKPALDNYIALDTQATDVIQSFFALATVVYDDLARSENPTDQIMAEQVATGVHDIIGRFVTPVGFTRFLRTINLRLMATPQFTTRDQRARLTNIVAQHSLAIRLAVVMMLRLGLIPYGMHSDIVKMLTDTRAVERAASSTAFAKLLNGYAK